MFKQHEMRQCSRAVELIHRETYPMGVGIVLPHRESLKQEKEQPDHSGRYVEAAERFGDMRMKHTIEEVGHVRDHEIRMDVARYQPFPILVIPEPRQESPL